ncbi:hypothetical protein niasHT_032582 [Heterodera trifolii]|uniref:Ubiquitin-like domain-containing protein n=1 Tax=Heterodera trifolii TaxID=157864 RepID=A0ABD2IJS0_9BILA
MKHFGLFVFPVGISAGLMSMLLLVMMMPSSIDGIKITVKEQLLNKLSLTKTNTRIKTNTITVEVNPSDTVKDLKNKIKNVGGTEPKMQRLELKKPNGMVIELKDSETMTHYGIEEGTTVLLFKNSEITVVIADEKSANGDYQFTIYVNGREKVEDLKKKISNQSGFDPDDQILKCNAANGPEMEDKKTFNKYGIGNGTTIFLSVKFEITVTADEHIFDKLLHIKTYTITVKVNGTQKVEDLKKNIMEKLKKKIKTKLGNDHKRLTLQYGQNDDILRDGQIINGYGIKKGDTVHLSIGEFQIVVQYQKEDKVENYPIWVKSEETVAILKKKIQNESGIQLVLCITFLVLFNYTKNSTTKKFINF